jgi:hypothetical protein
MANFFVKSSEERKYLKNEIELYLESSIAHNLSFYEQNADFVIDIRQDGTSGKTGLKTALYDSNEEIVKMHQSIVKNFIDAGLKDAEYPVRIYTKEKFEKPTLLLYTGRKNQGIDEELWAELIMNGIFSYFRFDDIVVPHKRKEKSSTVKRTFEKTNYNRNFEQKSTNNASKLFKR